MEVNGLEKVELIEVGVGGLGEVRECVRMKGYNDKQPDI